MLRGIMTKKGRALRHGVLKGSRLLALIGVAVMFLPSLATCAADLPGILGEFWGHPA
jgi:hypothetical protein